LFPLPGNHFFPPNEFEPDQIALRVFANWIMEKNQPDLSMPGVSPAGSSGGKTLFSGMIQSGLVQVSVYPLFPGPEVIIPENRGIIHPVLPDFTSENRR
jgi:hypothetical protein